MRQGVKRYVVYCFASNGDKLYYSKSGFATQVKSSALVFTSLENAVWYVSNLNLPDVYLGHFGMWTLEVKK